MRNNLSRTEILNRFEHDFDKRLEYCGRVPNSVVNRNRLMARKRKPRTIDNLIEEIDSMDVSKSRSIIDMFLLST